MDDHSHDPDAQPDSADATAEMLDLDAEVFHAYLSDAIAWVGDLATGRAVRRIVDLGSGTGTATTSLAREFPGADVLAVDSSAELLGRVRTRARDLGMASRVATLQADLDGPWPIADPPDAVWASMSLHHLADPDRVLADAFAGIRPGGLVAVADMVALPRFLPDDVGIGLPGLEPRLHAALAEAHTRQLPTLGSDWGRRLSQAGFAAVSERTFAIVLDPPHPPSSGRYAQAFLRNARTHLGDAIATDDQAALDALIGDGPHSILDHQGLVLRSTRTVWAGSRP